MDVRAAGGNYRNDHLLLGFSDLRRLKTERPLVISRGRGIFVFDENGKDYIEAVSCFYCVALGFSDEELIEAAVRQLRTMPMYPAALHRTTPPVMELAERLAAIAPLRNARVTFAATGSEMNDHLVKFMWYGNGFAGEPQRRKMISREASYHGSTIATAPPCEVIICFFTPRRQGAGPPQRIKLCRSRCAFRLSPRPASSARRS